MVSRLEIYKKELLFLVLFTPVCLLVIFLFKDQLSMKRVDGFDAVRQLYGPNPFVVAKVPKMSYDSQAGTEKSTDRYSLMREDYIALQGTENVIRARIVQVLDSFYPGMPEPKAVYGDFMSRTSMAISQTYASPEGEFISKTVVIEMGNSSSNHCIISSVKSNEGLELSRFRFNRLKAALIKQNFNGKLIYLDHAFPNPTGHEVKYFGVPYAIKNFFVLDAKTNYGCELVLWQDNGMIAKTDISPLFKSIAKNGALFRVNHDNFTQYIFPETRRALVLCNGVDPTSRLPPVHIPQGVFGFNMMDPLVDQVFQLFYRHVELGWPFFSCLPEEFVMASILLRPEMARLLTRWESILELWGDKKCEDCYFSHDKM